MPDRVKVEVERPAGGDGALAWRTGELERRVDAVEKEQAQSRRDQAEMGKNIAKLSATVEAAIDSMRSLRNAVYAATGTAVVVTVTAFLVPH